MGLWLRLFLVLVKSGSEHLVPKLDSSPFSQLLFESGNGWIQSVGALEGQHPPWILRGKSADIIQLPKLVLGECEFDRREIVLNRGVSRQ